MLCKRVVLAAKSGAIPEFVIDNANGFLFRAGDPIDLSQKIIAIQRLTNDDFIANNAYTSAKNMFNVFKQGEKVLRVYANLYSQKHALNEALYSIN